MKLRNAIFISLLLIVTLVGSSSISFAESKNNLNNVSTVSLNEYDMLKELSLISNTELTSMGFSPNEVIIIKDYHQHYVDHLNKLRQFDDSTLLAHDYTLEQIKIFKDFDESEEQILALAANLSIHSNTNNFTFDGNYSRGRLSYSWDWAGQPFFKLQDAVVASWNSWVVESNQSFVSYYDVFSGAFHTQQSATFTTDGNGTEGAGHKFNVSMSNNQYYAKNGGGSFNVRSDVHAIKDFYYYIAYGHSQITANINFSISGGYSPFSISFNVGTNVVGDHSGNYIY